MENSASGTAILIVAAAGLWLLYLVPLWRRRSEYLATERNAVRLQQTLRIMAQTTELPEAVRAEMTAREIAAQERSLAARQREQLAIERAREAARQRALRVQLAQTAPGLVAEVDASRLGQRRLRRSRAVTSLLTLAALVGVGVSLAVGAWAWTGLAGFVALSGLLLLRGLARASRRRFASIAPAAPRFVDYAPAAPIDARQAGRERAWTPVPLPRPTYLDLPAAPAAMRDARPATDHAAVLAAAAAQAEQAQRLAQPPAAPAEVPGPTVREEPSAGAALADADLGDSRFARMGIVDGLPTRAPDLDEVLQRRRAAG